LLLELLRDLLAPRDCPGCGGVVERRAIFCPACAATVERCPDAAGSVCRAAHVFGGAVRDAIHRLKYGKRSDLAVPLGHLLRACLVREPIRDRVDFVVPVPLHLSRLVDRGFNQSGLLAGAVARHLSVPLRIGVLGRVATGPAQATLSRAERLVNVASSFRVARPRVVRGKHVLIIDDVITTGATLDACRRALLDAGAGRVTCLALARAGLDRDRPPR
jgi:ComF family protein